MALGSGSEGIFLPELKHRTAPAVLLGATAINQNQLCKM